MGALKWNFERMNELELFLPDGAEAHNGPVLIQAGPQHPFYAAFYPGPAISMGYEKLKLLVQEAETLLGPPTEKSDSHVGWYFNPNNRHVAPYLRAKVTKEGLGEWKIGNR